MGPEAPSCAHLIRSMGEGATTKPAPNTEEGDARRYYRLQTKLDIGKDDMDDAGATNIAALKAKAQEIIDKPDTALETLCAQLIA
jgi:uncharacterized protein